MLITFNHEKHEKHESNTENEKEEIIYKKLVKSELNYKLKLANAENIFFKDYVIDRIEKAIPETIFSKKIQFAFDFLLSPSLPCVAENVRSLAVSFTL